MSQRRIIQIIGSIILLTACLAQVRSAAAQPAPPSATDFIGAVSTGDPIALRQAGVSWFLTYANYNITPIPGMHMALVVRLVTPPSFDVLTAAVRRNPGSAWLIGNEPNVQQIESSDGIAPAQYAAIFHSLARAVHQADPTAIVVGPNVLNWTDTCVGCGGYTRGSDWTAAFYASYQATYGTRPPVDRWAIHTYELDWSHLPMLHPEFDIKQLSDFRHWLESQPAEAGKPIWNSELGYNWAFSGFRFDSSGKVLGVGEYDNAGVDQWLSAMLNWLATDGLALGIERTFLYAQAPQAESFQASYGGLALFHSNTRDAEPTAAGRQLKEFLSRSGRS